MTFATEKEKIASERFQLVRIQAKIDVTADDVAGAWGRKVLVTGRPYEMSHLTWSKTLADAGSDPYATEVFTQVFVEPTGTMTDKTWYYEESTGYVHFNSTTTDTVNNTYRQYLVMEEFLTGNVARYAPRDPEAAGDNVCWKPLLVDYPEVSVAIDDIATGIFSFSAGSLNIINDGNFLGRYFSSTGSLSGREIKIWQCINDVSNIELAYVGKIANGSLSGNVANLRLLDSTSELDRTAVFDMVDYGTTAESLMIYGTTKSIMPEDIGKPIPRFFMRTTPFADTTTGTTGFSEELFTESIAEFLYTGICTDYTRGGGNTYNREWVCGILSQNVGSDSVDLTIPTQSFGSIVRATTDGAYSAYFYVNSMVNVYVGQTVIWTEGATTYYGFVQWNRDNTYLGNTYNLQVSTSYTTQTVVAASTSSTFTACKAISVYMERTNATGFEARQLVYSRDYSASVSSIGHVMVTLVNSFETNWAGFWDSDYIVPEEMRMFYAYAVEGDLNHAVVLDYLITAAGLTIDSTTFDDAATNDDVDTAFAIPPRGEMQIGTYADYIGKILESMGGYLVLNASGAVEYHIFEAPAASTEVTSAEFSDLSIDIEYQDTFDRLRIENKEWTGYPRRTDYVPNTANLTNTRAKVSIINRQLRELCDNRRTKYIDIVIENYSTSGYSSLLPSAAEERLLWLNSNRRAKITLKTATKHIDARPGDDITLVADNLPGGATSMNLKVVRKTTNGKETTIEALDLADYPG